MFAFEYVSIKVLVNNVIYITKCSISSGTWGLGHGCQYDELARNEMLVWQKEWSSLSVYRESSPTVLLSSRSVLGVVLCLSLV